MQCWAIVLIKQSQFKTAILFSCYSGNLINKKTVFQVSIIKQNKQAVSFKYLAHLKVATNSKNTNLELFPLNLLFFCLIKTGFFHLDKIRHKNRQKCRYHWLLYQKSQSATSNPDFLCVYNIFSKRSFCEISKQL